MSPTYQTSPPPPEFTVSVSYRNHVMGWLWWFPTGHSCRHFEIMHNSNSTKADAESQPDLSRPVTISDFDLN